MNTVNQAFIIIIAYRPRRRRRRRKIPGIGRYPIGPTKNREKIAMPIVMRELQYILFVKNQMSQETHKEQTLVEDQLAASTKPCWTKSTIGRASGKPAAAQTSTRRHST